MLPGPGQMAQLLHSQDSGFYGRKEMGGRWSFLELFGLRRRLRSTKKMLSDKKHGKEKSTGGSRLRGCYVPFKDEDGVTDEQRVIIDEHINTKVTNKQKGSKKSSGKSGLKSLFSRKLHGKEDQKEKMLPVGPKLLRTLSIHYLENNDYVLDGQSAANGDGSSHGAKLSLQNGTSANLQQDTFSNLDGTGTDTGLPRLSANGDDNVTRKSHRSISMDGILHKVPYGQRVSGDNIRLELPRSASATYDRDGLKPSYIGTAAKRQGSRGFRRSRSLSESLESYSHLLDSISSSESKRVLTSSKSTRDHSLDGTGAAAALQRTSNSQLRSKSVVRLAEFLVIPEDTLAAEVPEEIVGDVKPAVDEGSCGEVAGGSENLVSLEELLSDKKCDVMESSTEADLCIAPLASSEMVDVSEGEAATSDDDLEVLSSTQVKLCTDPSASEADIPEEHATSGDNDHIHSSTESDPCTLLSLLQSEDIDIAEQQVTPNSDDQIQSGATAHPSEDIDIAEEHAMISEDNQIQSFDALKSVKGTCCVPDPNRDTEDELNLCCEQETESPTSVLDVAFSDHPAASSEKNHTLLDDSSSLEKTVHSSESPDHLVDKNDDDLESSTPVKPPTSSSSALENMLQENNLGDLNALQEEAAADPRNEAELAYVKDIFSKSSFRDEALFDGWCSQNRAALQEDDCQHYDAAAAAIDFTDMSADELLLFDLTNEALLDVYKDYAAGVSRQPRFSSFQRPKPVGERALRELRRRVGRRLDERPRASVEVDAVLSSDLAEAERWSNFRREADQVASLVADSVLDRLVAELALQLVKF